MPRGAAIGVAIGALVVGSVACSGSDDAPGAAPETSTSTTAPSRPFEGDPGSPFCQLVSDAQPVADPFEAGLPPAEVQDRLGELRSRFGTFEQSAPPELADVLRDLAETLEELDATLAEHGYDFERVADSGTDLADFDRPAFAAAAERIARYRDEVCEAP